MVKRTTLRVRAAIKYLTLSAILAIAPVDSYNTVYLVVKGSVLERIFVWPKTNAVRHTQDTNDTYTASAPSYLFQPSRHLVSK